jgi:hypothetical protein
MVKNLSRLAKDLILLRKKKRMEKARLKMRLLMMRPNIILNARLRSDCLILKEEISLV